MASLPENACRFWLASCIAAAASHAVLSWTDCKDVAESEFRAVPLVTRATDLAAEPMKMAFDLLADKGEDAKGKVDVYFTERLGNVRKYDSRTGTVITLARIPLNINPGQSSEGVLGIALDPAFKTNHRVYIYYTFVGAAEKSWRVSRFTLSPAHDVLELATEIPVLKIPIYSGSTHPGGAIQFDSYGDLWISTGNDHGRIGGDFPTYSSPNTNDLRGKILRIHPTEDGKYSIPEGNLFKAGAADARPEIYIMGTRNPYTLTLDPVRRWVTWGDVGPDGVDMDKQPMNQSGQTMKTEEYDLATAPGNYGYPFFAGDYRTKSGIDAGAPAMDDSTFWGESGPGMKTLPPAIAPIWAYRKACAVTGPIFRYDGDLNSSVKFPPHFARKWMVTDFNGDGNKMTLFTLAEDAAGITGSERVLRDIPLHSPLDMQQGPDGALYVINYDGYRSSGANTGIIRIEYTGDCRPAQPKMEAPIATSFTPLRPALAFQAPKVEIQRSSGLKVAVATRNAFTLVVRDLKGRTVASRSATGPAPLSLDEVSLAGVYLLSVTTPEGLQTLTVVRD